MIVKKGKGFQEQSCFRLLNSEIGNDQGKEKNKMEQEFVVFVSLTRR